MSDIANNKRIAKNTLLLYLRMLLTMGLSLYTSRLVLQVLGIHDVGINSVVGSVITMMTIVNASMSLSMQRFFSYDLGRRDITGLNTCFSMSMILHIFMALLVLLLGETLGLYMVLNHINYPPERSMAVMWVYQLSLISASLGITQIPYTALIVAYEKMGAFAYLSVLSALLQFALILLIKYLPYDKLICYSLSNLSIGILMMSLHVVFCMRVFREIRFRWIWDKSIARKMIDFAGWSTLGELAWMGTNQGVTVVINLFFGTAVNAVRGIAFQIKAAVMKFVAAFQTAMNPQIIKLYAAGEMEEMQKLVNRGTCFSFYLSFFLSLPLLLKTELIIHLWLGQVPQHIVIFSQLILLNIMCDILSNLLTTVVKAHGQIRTYQIIVSSILMLNCPITYGLYYYGAPPCAAYVVYSVISLALLPTRLVLLKRMVNISIRKYIGEVLRPILMVSAVASLLPLMADHVFSESTVQDFLIVAGISAVSVAATVYLLGLHPNERQLINSKIRTLLKSIH